MTQKTLRQPRVPFFSFGPANPNTARKKATHRFGEKPPRQPDWLLVWMGILFLLTLLIAWLADIPGILR